MLAIRSEASGRQPGNKHIRADEGRRWGWGEYRTQLLVVTMGQASEKPREDFCHTPGGTVCTCVMYVSCRFGQPFSPTFSCARIILYRMNLEQSACIPISALLLGNKYLT